MNAETAVQKIKGKIAGIDSLRARERFSSEFKKWYRDTTVLLQRIFGEDAHQVTDFTSIDFVYRGLRALGDPTPLEGRYRDALKECAAILTSIYEEIEEFGVETKAAAGANPITSIELLLARFHSVARQLRQRHLNRETLDLDDEYDVQDLLHCLLQIFFRDIRSEEWTPSYAGNASRMDFLLHQEAIVIETKMTRKGMTAKEIVDQLIIDIARYREHPGCKMLVCFVYDPEGYIGNAAAVVSDLENESAGLPVRVFVQPQNG